MEKDIDNLKEVLLCVLDIKETLKTVFEDNKVSLGEAFSFIEPIRKLGEIVADRKEIITELKDLSSEEKSELSEFINENSSDEIVNTSLDTLLNIIDLFFDISRAKINGEEE